MPNNREIIAALIAAIPSVQGSARSMLLDDLLGRLDREAPEMARIAAGIVGAYDKTTSDAIRARFGEYSGGPLAPDPAVGKGVDCLILTIKDNELAGAKCAFDIPDEQSPISYGQGLMAYHVTREDISYAIAMTGTAGNVESAIVLGGLVNALRPRAAALIGMAAGVRGKVKLGDVVVAETVFAYEFKKMQATGPVYMPKSYAPREAAIRSAEAFVLANRGWATAVAIDALSLENPEPFKPNDDEPLDGAWRPNVSRAGILAGGQLLEDGSLPELASKIHARVSAAEMDGAGFAAACNEANLPWIAIRGIADYGEKDRRKPWQLPATFAAARYFRSALAGGFLELGIRGPR